MLIEGVWSIFSFGCLGGFLMELLKWYRLREEPTLPVYAHSVFYWTVSLLMIFVSGMLAAIYGTNEKNALLVLNIGASAPLLLKALAEQASGRPSEISAGNASQSSQTAPREDRTPGFHYNETAASGWSADHSTDRLNARLLQFLSWR